MALFDQALFAPSKHSLPFDFDACQLLHGRQQEAVAFQVNVNSNVSVLMVVADLAHVYLC